MISNIEIRNNALDEVKSYKINDASKARISNNPRLIVLEDDNQVVWVHYKKGTHKFHNKINFNYLKNLSDHCWSGRVIEDVMVIINKYIEDDGDFVLYEVTI